MFRFEYLLPTIYATFISIVIIKEGLIDLGMNTVTWCVYFANIFIAYILSKLGKGIDKCLALLF